MSVPASRVLDALLAATGGSDRPGQRQMVDAVERAIKDEEHLVVQAGTGTGKSFAYLVPAVASGRTVVVATATKALQAQLVTGDLPRLIEATRAALGHTPTFALLKGRSNYACVHKVEGGSTDDEPDALFEDEPGWLGRQVLTLRAWVEKTDTGDRDDVPFPVDERAWRQVSVTAHDCLGTKCPSRDRCFSEKAREDAREADVVVTNHTMLAIDLGENQLLPEHEVVIIDEAHELVASVTSAFTDEVSGPLVTQAAKALRGADVDGVDRLAGDLVDLGDALGTELMLVPAGLVKGKLAAPLVGVLRALADVLAEANAALAPKNEDDGDRQEPEDDGSAARLRARTLTAELGRACERVRKQDETEAVWVVHSEYQHALVVAPLEVRDVLATKLFPSRTVVLTSATLTVGGSFTHLAHELGLPREGWTPLDVGSPFDYPKQGILYVAQHLPAPGTAAWAQAVDDEIVALAKAAGGRTLGLFSSVAAARRAAESARNAGLTVLLQGDDSPGALAHQFKADAQTCLFGVRTFWQGVDVPGSACQLVVVDRLPFPHVEDPLVQARSLAAEARGRNGFTDVSVPVAAVLLAQGVGRLIRSVDDRGVVAVLDQRLATKGYGRTIRAGLPPLWWTTDGAVARKALERLDATAAPVRDPGVAPASRPRPVVRPPAPRTKQKIQSRPFTQVKTVRDDAGYTWSEFDDGLLRRGVAAGRSTAQLAKRHEMPEDVVLARIQTLGLR